MTVQTQIKHISFVATLVSNHCRGSQAWIGRTLYGRVINLIIHESSLRTAKFTGVFKLARSSRARKLLLCLIAENF